MDLDPKPARSLEPGSARSDDAPSRDGGGKAFKGRPSTRKSREKDVLNSLLSAARQCLESSDSSRITVRQIANVAHVNQAMVNYYFESKDGLFASLYERDIVDLARKLESFLKEVGGDENERPTIEALLKLIDEHFEERKVLYVLMHNDLMHEESALYQTYNQRLASRGYSIIVRIMAAFMRTGQCRTDVTPEHAAYVVCSLCAIPFLLSPIFNVAFNSKVDGDERERRRGAVALLLKAPTA